MYMVIDKSSGTKWAVSDDFNTFVEMCKYLKRNMEEAENFTVVLKNDSMIKEKAFLEFCAVQEI